jgi:hypothetical protein
MQENKSIVDVTIDSSIKCYNDSKSNFYATRAGIFLSEAFKEQGAYKESALFMIRMSADVECFKINL